MRKLLLGLAIFFMVILVLQALLYHALLRERLPENLLLAETLSENPPDVLYFGDSSTFWNSGTDTDRRGLDRMVADALPGYRICALNHNAYHLEVFEEYTRFFEKRNALPRCLLVVINLRSFSPLWDQRPEYQFMRERCWLHYDYRLVHLFFRFLCTFNAFDMNPVSQAEFLRTPVMAAGKHIGVVSDFVDPHTWPDRNAFRAGIFQCNYLYTLRPEHPKLRALAQLLACAKEHNVPVLCYVTPIDYETGRTDTGTVFEEQVDANIRVIRDCAEPGGAVFLDLSRLVHAEEFNWYPAPNEHLRQAGRLRVSEVLADALREMLEEMP